MREVTEIDILARDIAQFFTKKQNKTKLLTNLGKKETLLLASMKFGEFLQNEAKCVKNELKRSEWALLGLDYVETDYLGENTIIDAKYIRKKRDGTWNECDIKNGLSQVIEQAICYGVSQAILLVIDAGRASGREWNEDECKFISMFQQKSFDIELSIVRIRIHNNVVDSQIIRMPRQAL